MDTHLDILSTKLYQVNVRVGCIARRQEIMAGFAPEASNDNDRDASSTDEMST